MGHQLRFAALATATPGLQIGKPIRIEQPTGKNDTKDALPVATWKIPVTVDGLRPTDRPVGQIIIESLGDVSPVYVPISLEDFQPVRAFPAFLVADLANSTDRIDNTIHLFSSVGEEVPNAVSAVWDDNLGSPITVTIIRLTERGLKVRMSIHKSEAFGWQIGELINLKLSFKSDATKILSLPVKCISKSGFEVRSSKGDLW